jgi:hypothetical protein
VFWIGDFNSVAMKSAVLWVKTPLEGGSMQPASAGFLLSLLFDPEDGGYMFLQNVVLYPNYTALQPKTELFITSVSSENHKSLNTFCALFNVEAGGTCRVNI